MRRRTQPMHIYIIVADSLPKNKREKEIKKKMRRERERERERSVVCGPSRDKRMEKKIFFTSYHQLFVFLSLA